MLKSITALITSAVILLLITLSLCALSFEKPTLIVKNSEKTNTRIISLTPSVTEMLYYMGAGDMVKARTRYCSYPPEVEEKPELGGLFDVNYEAVLSLSPDIVILSEIQIDVIARLKALGVNILTVDHATLDGVIASFSLIGDAIGRDGNAMAEILKWEIDRLRQKTAAYPSKKVIIAVSSEGGRYVAAGKDGYYSEALKLLNAVNPLAENAPYTTITKEGLEWIKPDVLITLSYGGVNEAYEEGVCVVNGSFGFTPGPRFPLLMESFARCIYPEGFSDGS
jgi:iron complex transport system substrate-binding protein